MSLAAKKKSTDQETKKSANTSLIISDSPIGLFDSGIGGLSVYQHIKQLLPHESYVYYADTLNVPYGGRDKDEIIKLTLNAVDKLHNLGCKLIVIACNSASANTLDILRGKFPNTPIVGLVPALKPAVYASKTKKVAVLATQATLVGNLLQCVIDEVAIPSEVIVSKYYEADLVPWVELGMPTTSDTVNILKKLLNRLAMNDVDQLVLGCTHYPFFRQFLEKYIEENRLNISIVDSGSAIALRVKSLLLKNKLGSATVNHSDLQIYTSKYTENQEKSIKFLLGRDVFISSDVLL